MSFFHSRNYVDLKSKGITVDNLMEILDIEQVSAEELLDGTISFTKSEMEEIARYKGVPLEALIGDRVDCLSLAE